MKKLIAFALLILVSSAPAAHAWIWSWAGEECRALKTAGESCEKKDNVATGAYGQSFSSMDCDDTSIEGFICHFRRPTGTPALGTVEIDLNLKPSTGSGNVCTEVQIGCSDLGGDLAYGTAVRVSTYYASSVFWADVPHANVTFPNNTYGYCGVRVRRIHGDGACTDDVTGDVKFRAGYAE